MPTRYRIQFPRTEVTELEQDEVYFYLNEDGERVRLRLHDYDELYKRPGLYEQVIYERLKCSSPQKVGEILKKTLRAADDPITELRVLDLGAGNGIMGEVLKDDGVARVVGIDIVEDAKKATYRDRPHAYDEYYVADFTKLDDDLVEELDEWSFNCLTVVAALGFGDVPPDAYFQAMRFVRPGGWVALNIKETFLSESDTSGFSRAIRELISSEYLDVFHMEKYRHRYSMEGIPLFYFAIVAQKTAEIPDDFIERLST